MLPGVELARRRRTSNYSCVSSDRSSRSTSNTVTTRDKQQQRQQQKIGVPRSSSEIEEAAANALATLQARYRFHPRDEASRTAANEARERLEARLRAPELRITRHGSNTVPTPTPTKKKFGSGKLQILSHKDERPECPICLEEIGRTSLLLPCRHGFHKECIEPWIERSNHCPCCRASVV